MNKHANLLKEARDVADNVDAIYHTNKPGVITTPLRALADIVEQQDARLVECGRALVDATNSKAELAAACVACDEAISQLILKYEPISPDKYTPKPWSDARAARNLARRVVKLAEPESNAKDDRAKSLVAETLRADATGNYDELLKRLAEAKGDTTERPSEPPAPRLADAVDDLVAESNQLCEHADTLRCIVHNVVRARCHATPPPPVKVEMRVKLLESYSYTWECTLGGLRFDHSDWGNHNPVIVREKANAWLAALSDQLGVRLEAAWKDDVDTVDTESRCQRCGRPVERIRGEIPTSCSGCASD
jgi:hypothetical protein